jgi:hypothetical protein
LADKEIGAVRITLMVYSGRPNPVWELGGADARPLLEALSRGVREGGRVAPPSDPGLGYRGFLVTPSTPIDELGEQVVVHRRVITKTERRKSDWFVDVAGAERLLIRQARENGQGEVLAALGVDVE